RDEAALAAAGAGGAAWALAGLLRAVPFHAAQGRVLLPDGAMAEEGASPDDLLAGRGGEALGRVVASVARAARDRLADSRRAEAAIPRGARPAVAHFSLIEPDLRRLARAGYDVFALTPSPPFPRHCRIIAAGVTGRW